MIVLEGENIWAFQVILSLGRNVSVSVCCFKGEGGEKGSAAMRYVTHGF